MDSKSSGYFLDLASGVFQNVPQTPDGNVIGDVGSYSTPFSLRGKIIIVANILPLHAKRDNISGKWSFALDEDSLLLQLKDGFPTDTEVFYVGSLKAECEPNEQEEIAQILLDDFNCVPTFLPQDIQQKFYHGFCKQHLWPLFHYMLPMCIDHGDYFDRDLWQAYVSANKTFAYKIMEVINPEDDFVWIHDYHLMVLPTFLRKNYNQSKIGFFLHSPFPSSEIYRSLPVRDEILKGLLNSDLIGFHTFDYARHFLSCCGRMLGLDYKSKRGHIGLDYFGRTVYVKILPVGIHMGRQETILNLPSTREKLEEIREKFKGKKIILGVDDMDIFKGISLKLMAFEKLLSQYRNFQGKLVLVQIVNPARSSGKVVNEAESEMYAAAERINKAYSGLDYSPVVLIDRYVARDEKTAYYSLAECCIVNAVRDGMNLVPYKYIVCRQGYARSSMLVVSEFIGCTPSLCGAIRVNPWDVVSVAEAMNTAISMRDETKQIRHEKNYRFVSSHDVAYWARSFLMDLERACKEHIEKRCWGIGLGLGFRVISLSPSFRRLVNDHVVSAYRKTSRRVIFLDYDGTIVPQESKDRFPSDEVVNLLGDLCKDPNNTVFIVSGRGRSSLSGWLAPCGKLGLAAEHGYFIRWKDDVEWESLASDLDWKKIVEPIMNQYTDATDGSSIEVKDSAFVWHYQDADPEFGSCQAKELLLHLENVLANEPAFVWRGQHIVEVKPQGVTKGLVAEKVLTKMISEGNEPDFVMCIGDDRSDEDMFESISSTVSGLVLPEIFACTVGQKPSKAMYYLDDTDEVLKLLHSLVGLTTPRDWQMEF